MEGRSGSESLHTVFVNSVLILRHKFGGSLLGLELRKLLWAAK